MNSRATPRATSPTTLAGWFLSGFILVFPACEPVGRSGALQRNDAVAPTAPGGEGATAPAGSEEDGTSRAGSTSGGNACVVSRTEPPPPEAQAATTCPPAPTAGTNLPQGMVHFIEAPGAPGVTVEIASTSQDQARGLMYRTSLGEDAGMLFSWEYDAPRSFWMRNTCIPLDMLFIDASGRIAQILEQVPTLNDDPRRTACSVRHVLEVNAGWTRDHGVLPGQHVQLPKENQ